MQPLKKSPDYLYNHITKSFARQQNDNQPHYPVAEAWRFPVLDCYRSNDDDTSYYFNEVTFVYPISRKNPPGAVAVIGTFHELYQPVPLERLEDSMYYTVTLKIPKGQVHYYRFLVDGRQELDNINPQRQVLDDGVEWSRFFTQSCAIPISFERWEWVLLERLTDHILPFRTEDGRRFMNQYNNNQIDHTTRARLQGRAHLLDQSVGVVNYIDKIVAREEHHRLVDYKICLEICDQLLRKRNPFQEPSDMSHEMFVQLYGEMGTNNVPGWDYSRYSSPAFFLKLLRRHTLTGAFCHPKYGGNAACAGWAFLSERYKDKEGKSLFNWQLAIEKPLGQSTEYYG
ncbi:MAG TPA: gluconate 2-dehydrogenase subunit 3 family protein [Flavisolibacter sp.]|jgi:hypothetical protein|nr:gluconate 2-dehydrogenase subunit 3 family protein [Flavisolibacter sp.]